MPLLMDLTIAVMRYENLSRKILQRSKNNGKAEISGTMPTLSRSDSTLLHDPGHNKRHN